MKGIIYVRVSSDEQVLGTSLAFQEEICLKYCTEHRIEVESVFREEGASAKTAKRPELVRALEFCRRRRPAIQAFVVAKVDRFARNTEDHFTIRGLLKRCGVNLHSVTEPIGNSPTERLLETVLAGSAEFDNAIRTQRSTDGMKAQLRRGIWPWQVPVGYLSARTKKKGLKKLAPDPIDPERFPIIQRGLHTYAAGTVQSLSQLAVLLNSWGLTSAQGRPISVQMVDDMLGRHLGFYAGALLDPFSKEELPGRHMPMISEQDRRRIRLIRSGKMRHMKVRDHDAPHFPLRRTILCGGCGRPHTASSPRGHTKRYPYYHCANKGCSLYGKSYGQEAVEAKFAAKLSQLRPRWKTLVAVLVGLVEYSKHEIEHQARIRRSIEERIRKLEAQRSRIFEMREDDSYTREQFLERQRANDAKLDAVHVELADLNEGSSDIGSLVRDGLKFVADLTATWIDLEPRLKRRFQRVIYPLGIPYCRDLGFGTVKLGPLFEVFCDFGGSFSGGVPREGTDWNLIIADLLELRAIYDEWKAEEVPQLPTSPDPPNRDELKPERQNPPSLIEDEGRDTLAA